MYLNINFIFIEDLWYHLEMKSKKPVIKVMNTWTDKMGYPVISVSDEQTRDGVRILKVDSKKFNADGLEGWI